MGEVRERDVGREDPEPREPLHGRLAVLAASIAGELSSALATDTVGEPVTGVVASH